MNRKSPAPAGTGNGAQQNASQIQSTAFTPRHQRLLQALLQGPVTRKEADAICHSSNSPHVVFKLRRAGIPVETDRVPFVTFDGAPGQYGKYWLTEESKKRARELLEGRA